MSPLAPKTLLLDIARSGDRVVAVGERGHIIYSDNNGQSWQQAQVPVRETLTSLVFPDGGQTGWAAGHSGVVLISRDSGETWQKQLDGYQLNKIMVAAYEAAVSTKTEELDSVAAKDKEQFQTELENLELLLSDTIAVADAGPFLPLIDIYFRDERQGFAVGTFGLILQTHDGGETWDSPAPSIENPNGLHYNTITEIDNVLFLVGESGFVARSFDTGKSWEILETTYGGTFFNAAGDQRSIVLLGLQGHAVISFDRGASWETVETGVKRTLTSAQVLDDGRLLVSQYGRPLLISNEDRTHLVEFPWPAGISVTSFVLGDDGSLLTVGVGGVTRVNRPDFSIKVN